MQVVPTTGQPSLTAFEEAVDKLELAAAAPVVIQKLLAVLADPRATDRDLEQALAADPSLVTRLVRLASSAAYARRPVRDLPTAIRTVGVDALRQLAVTAHFASAPTPFARELWSYALAVAFTSERLAASAGAPGADSFLAGLLHDMGTLVMARLLGARYARLGVVPGDHRQCALEREAFGFDHCDLGAMAVARWNLFPELELVVQLHHDPRVAERLALAPATVRLIERIALARLAVLATGDATGEPAEDSARLVELAGRCGLTVEAVRAHAEAGRAQATAVMGALTP